MILVDSLGRWSVAKVEELGNIAVLPYRAFKSVFVERGRGRRLVVQSTAGQVYFTAIQPLPIFLVIALVTGFVVHVAADTLMRRIQQDTYISDVAVTGLGREVIPLLLAFVLIGRSGSAITSELAYMRANQEIDAIAVAGINIDYLVVLPRLAGLVISAIGLTTVMTATAIIGGYFAASFLEFISVAYQFGDVLDAFTVETIVMAWVKAAAFGTVIATVSCFHGLSVGRAYADIPRANTRATVECLLLCLGLNTLLSVYAVFVFDAL